ncbi:MAG: RecQ family ATP-dependent DNA helicase [Treponema sp.]|nr:RecQ family ATP-dependent DNA helicase [Treponema sp.]
MDDILKFDTTDDIYSDDLIAKAAFDNFGIKYLFPWQRLVIANILEAYEFQKELAVLSDDEKKDFLDGNEDSFCKGRQIVLLPTGAGKSLCFQVPALLLNGPTLIIYPLLALMTDQQRRMEEGALRSVTFRGGQTDEERNECFEKLKNGYKIIIANPEVLKSEGLVERLKTVGIVHVAIDESHCVSEWGDSFRPAYLELGKILEELKPPVITAFTATASPEVLARVSEILFGGEAHVVRSESDRQNIHYFLRRACSKKKEALFLAKNELRPMIIFCGTRHNCEDMAQELNVCFGRGTARFYHAGLDRDEKEATEKWFYESKDGILCATCAYGMGVDKKDIKTVVHLEPPATAEAYIQEAGRGGRDGSIAKAIMIWSLDNSIKYAGYKIGSREAAMGLFAETKDCRRQVLLDALGAEQAVCSGCDLCNARMELKRADSFGFFGKKIFLRKNRKNERTADWERVFDVVRKNKNFFSKDELEERIADEMNEVCLKEIGVKAWTHGDSLDVLSQLELSGKIMKGKFLWRGKYKAVKGR